MKRIILFVLLFHSICFSKEVVIKYKVQNIPTPFSVAFYLDTIVYLDTIGLSNSQFIIQINQPERVTVFINDDYKNGKKFYAELKNDTVCIDGKQKYIKVRNSVLNDEYIEDQKLLDSIRLFEKPIFDAMRNENNSKTTIDSLEKIIQKHESVAANLEYNKLLKMPKSFLALQFLNFYLNGNDFDRKKLNSLFYKLDNSLKKYPLHKECLNQIKNYKVVKIAKPNKRYK